MDFGFIFWLTIGIPLVANAISIYRAIEKGIAWKVIDLPLPTLIRWGLQYGLALIIAGIWCYDYLVMKQPTSISSALLLLWVALLHGLSAFLRWRKPPQEERVP